MGLKETFKTIGRGAVDGWKNAVDRLNANLEMRRRINQQELEDFVSKSVVELYRKTEQVLSEATDEFGAVRRGAKLKDPVLREIMRRTTASANLDLSSAIDIRLEESVQNILQNVTDPQKRVDIRKKALRGAVLFWEEALSQPDTTAELILLGRRRITKLSLRLELLDRIESN